MDEENFDDDAYRIRDWTPPWIDNGKRFKEIVDSLVEHNDDDAWKVMVVLFTFQMDYDIRLLKSLHDQLSEIERGMEL